MQYAPIGKLSGGEKRRLYLLGVLAENANVLLFDEAGNNLDIPTLTILEYTCDHLKNRRFSTAVRSDNSKPLIAKHNITEIIYRYCDHSIA